jgi:hypothetical protein
MEFRFCPICGSYLENDLLATQKKFPACPLGHFTLYPNLASLVPDNSHIGQPQTATRPQLMVIRQSSQSFGS